MCDDAQALLPALVAGRLGRDERASVEAHLAACADCRAEAAAWRSIAATVRTQAAARVTDLPPWTDPSPAPIAPVAPWGRDAWRQWMAGRPVARRVALVGALALVGLAIVRWGGLGRDEGSIDDVEVVDGRVAGQATVVVRRAIATTASGGDSGALDGNGGAIAARAGDGAAGESGAPLAVVRSGLRPLSATTRPVARVVAATPGRPAGANLPSSGPSSSPTTDPGPGRDDPAQPDDPADPDVRTPTAVAPTAVAPTSAPPTSAPPTSTPPATEVPVATTGTFTGKVKGPDGQPRAEIMLMAEPADAAGPNPAAIVTTLTGVDGTFSLAVPPGAWIVHAETPAFQLMWHQGRANPIHADAVTIAAGENIALDFNLEPNPAGLIAGHVTDADGAPVARALVIAAIPDDGDGGRPILTAAVFTGEDGAYELSVPPGAYMVAAGTTRRFEDLSWWGGDGTLAQSDRMGVRPPEAARVDVRVGR